MENVGSSAKFVGCGLLLVADRDLPIAQATNNRCGSVISRGAKFRRGPAPFRFFLQVKGNSTISVAGELVEMQKGSALTVLGREVSVDNQGELFEVWEEPVKGSRL